MGRPDSTARRLVPRPKPAKDADERDKAIYWRVNVMRLSQYRLARLLNLRRQTIIRVENGEQPVTRMFRLACIGLQLLRPWDPDEWPFYGNDAKEDAVFRRMLDYQADEQEPD